MTTFAVERYIYVCTHTSAVIDKAEGDAPKWNTSRCLPASFSEFLTKRIQCLIQILKPQIKMTHGRKFKNYNKNHNKKLKITIKSSHRLIRLTKRKKAVSSYVYVQVARCGKFVRWIMVGRLNCLTEENLVWPWQSSAPAGVRTFPLHPW